MFRADTCPGLAQAAQATPDIGACSKQHALSDHLFANVRGMLLCGSHVSVCLGGLPSAPTDSFLFLPSMGGARLRHMCCKVFACLAQCD
jgi:hypothetical protein